jgi:hypothetical protein
VTEKGDGVACAERYPEKPRPPYTPELPRPPAMPQPISVAISGNDGCVVDRSGHLTCWPLARNRWLGLYRAVAASGNRFCAVTADGRVRCDHDWPSGASSEPPPTSGGSIF